MTNAKATLRLPRAPAARRLPPPRTTRTVYVVLDGRAEKVGVLHDAPAWEPHVDPVFPTPPRAPGTPPDGLEFVDTDRWGNPI